MGHPAGVGFIFMKQYEVVDATPIALYDCVSFDIETGLPATIATRWTHVPLACIASV
jgi:hypothetical protein